ncbi:hypothetical protein ACXR2U_09730 [Jatrophihabitans sp. YIM 134969]
MPRHGGGGKIPEIVENAVKRRMRKTDLPHGHGGTPGTPGAPNTPGVPGRGTSPRPPHQHYDGTTRPALTPDGRNLTPPSNPASRPSLGDRLPPGSPNAKAQTKLHNILKNLYKGTDNPRGTVGDGRTADAHRWEQRSHEPLGRNPQGEPAWHGTKSQESVNGLENWLAKNPDAPQEWRDIAQAELDNLKNALGGH